MALDPTRLSRRADRPGRIRRLRHAQTYTAHGRMTMTQSPAEVWRRLHDPETYPMTGKMCKGVELLPHENGFAVWIENMGRSKLRIRDVEAREPHFLLRSIEDTVVPFRGRNKFTIEATKDGCVVTCQNQCTVKSGSWCVPFFRVMIGLFGGSKSGPKDYLTRISGGTGTIEWL